MICQISDQHYHSNTSVGCVCTETPSTGVRMEDVLCDMILNQ